MGSIVRMSITFWQRATVEPRFNEPLFNEVLDITNDILGPSKSYSKLYGIEPRYNQLYVIDICTLVFLQKSPVLQING